jgi:hypothetical protein
MCDSGNRDAWHIDRQGPAVAYTAAHTITYTVAYTLSHALAYTLTANGRISAHTFN